MTPKQIIEAIKAERPEINTLFFVGCGASSAEQYPAQYFMDCNAEKSVQASTQQTNSTMQLLFPLMKQQL